MGILLVTDSAGDPKSFTKAGSRCPGVFFQGSSKTTLIKHFIGDTDRSLDIKDLLAKDEPTSFKISQEMEDGKLMYKVNKLNQGLVWVPCPTAVGCICC